MWLYRYFWYKHGSTTPGSFGHACDCLRKVTLDDQEWPLKSIVTLVLYTHPADMNEHLWGHECFIKLVLAIWRLYRFLLDLLKWSSPFEHEILLCNWRIQVEIWVQIQPSLLGPLMSWGYPNHPPYGGWDYYTGKSVYAEHDGNPYH